jgi:hypothetical protein
MEVQRKLQQKWEVPLDGRIRSVEKERGIDGNIPQ